MSWFPVVAGAALIAFALWAMFKGGGPPTDDHGHDERQARTLE